MNRKVQPTWATWSEALRVIRYPQFLKTTTKTALVVGSVLFFINHLDEVLHGKATITTWIKGGATCLVPFFVANWGVLVATRRRRSSGAPCEGGTD